MGVIEICKTFVGTPYVWGGESLSEGGFDCSGFVYVVLRRMGLNVSRLTAQGFYNKYEKNSTGVTLKSEGALLFFGKDIKHITHVAINCGDGTMYESIGTSKNTKSNPGKGVTRSKINRRSDLIAVRMPDYEKEVIATPSPTLRKGSSGNQVKLLQKLLNQIIKAGLVVDGEYGEKTYKAVKTFQACTGLVADGIYGNKSYAMLSKINGGN